MTFVRTDILKPYQREIVSTDSYDTLIKFLIDIYPSGFDRPLDISVNGFTIPIDDWDIELNDDDIVVLLDRTALPAGYIAGSLLLTALANLAISVTLSYVVNKLFAPDAPEIGENAQPSSVYALNSAQNMARYGSPVPIIYGRVKMYPSMIVQPFYRYENNDEYLYHVMAVSQGRCTTPNVFIEDDIPATTGDMQWKILYQNTFYNIPVNAYGIHITKTLANPSNMELKNAVTTERYTISADTQKIEFDMTYPQGIYYSETDGSYLYHTSTVRYDVYNGVGTLVRSANTATTANSADPIQKTISIDVSGLNEEVYISFYKHDSGDNTRLENSVYIKRVKQLYANKDYTQLYGDITLLAVRIKATNISSAGQVKINAYFTRTDKSNLLGDVLTDIYTNSTYGGNLHATDLDFPVTEETVNCAFDTSLTIFDAMRRVAMARQYNLYLAGMNVILKKDGTNGVTSGMYNEMNILRNSLKVQYLFKEENPTYDSYACQYIDGDWNQQTAVYPANGYRSQTVELFGVAGSTDGASSVAEHMAEYLWKQDEFRRKTVTFQTDIQGLIPQYLDKILISHSAMQWGEAGEVYGRDGDSLELSDPLVDTSSGQTIVFRNIDGSVSNPYAITIIDEYNITVVGMPTWVTNNIFYTIQSAGTGREFLVISVKPSDTAVEIQAIDYNPEIYT